MITDEHFKEGEQHPTLGPAYFAARAIAERFMASFSEEQFKPLIDNFAKEFNDRLWNDLESSLLSDTESNLQSSMWRMVDQCVAAILSGERWVMEKYALGSRYDCDKVRETVAKCIPAELQDNRVTDLEAEVERLRREVQFLRNIR